MVGSNVAITYSDGSRWEVNVSEISDKYHRMCFEVVNAEPNVQCSSIQTEIQLHSCTYENSTCIRWTTEFSNDADANLIQDQKYKKHEFFQAIKNHLQL